VWPDITDSQRVAGIVLYRKTFWKNTHATDAMVAPVLWVSTVPSSAAFVIGLGADSADDTDAGQGNMTAWSGAAQVALISDGADTRVATIYGLDDSGTPVPVTETVTLTGASEVLSVNTYTKVWGVFLSAVDAGRIVLVKQGTGGTTRGTIGLSKKGCWLWVTATTKGGGIAMPDLAAAQNYGLWRRLTVSAGASPVRPNVAVLRIEEAL
jgi:hypothetical protein